MTCLGCLLLRGQNSRNLRFLLNLTSTYLNLTATKAARDYRTRSSSFHSFYVSHSCAIATDCIALAPPSL